MALQLRGRRSNITLNLSATFVAIFALVAQPLVALNLPSVFAASPEIIFSDSFESGDFTNWDFADADWKVMGGTTSDGTHKARVGDGAAEVASSTLTKMVSSVGYENLDLRFDRMHSMEGTDSLVLQYTYDGGATWTAGTNVASSATGNFTEYQSRPASAYSGNKSGFGFRFVATTSSASDTFDLDNVRLYGETIATPEIEPNIRFTTMSKAYGSSYDGIVVDFGIKGFSDATDCRIIMHRTNGGDAMRTCGLDLVSHFNSTADGSRKSTTAAFNVLGSSPNSWYATTTGTWGPDTVPTGVTIKIDTTSHGTVSRSSTGTLVEKNGVTYADIAPRTPAITDIRAELVNAPGYYTGIAVTPEFEGINDATEVQVIVTRDDNTQVTKVSRPGAGFIDSINDGTLSSVTAPIIIEDGSYGEDDSGSWKAAPAIWSEGTAPKSVEVVIKRSGGVDVRQTTTNFVTTGAVWGDIVPGPVYREGTVDGQTGAEEYFDNLQDAIDDNDGEVNGNSDNGAVGDGSTDAGDVIGFTKDLSLGSDVGVTKAITIDGNGNTINADFTKTDNDNNSALSIGSNDVTVRDLTLDGANGTNLHGVNAYKVTGTALNNLTINNFLSAVNVNGSTVSAHNLTTSGNSTWYGPVNIGQGSGVTTDASFTVTGASAHDESYAIKFEDRTNPGLSFTDSEGQYEIIGQLGTIDLYALKVDPQGRNQLNVSGTLYRDNKLNDCDNRTECLDRSSDRLEGWDVRLYKEDANEDWQPVKTVKSNSDGVYKFGAQQEAGVYHVCFVQKTGWKQSKQLWNGSGYLVETKNQSPNRSDESEFCATSTYADTSDRSWKQNIGNVDTGAPVVDINTPTAGKLVKGKVEIKGSVTDNHKLKNYYLTIVDKSDNSIVHTKNYSASDDVNGKLAEWDSASLSGDYRIIIEARDSANNKEGGRNPLPDTTEGASIDYVDVVVDNEAPVGELTAIGGKAYSYSGPELIVKSEGGKLVVTGEVEDNIAMNRVGVQLIEPGVSGDIDYVYANDNGLYGDTGLVQWEAEFDTDALAVGDGRYALNIAYVDKIGNVSKEKNLYFVLDNTAPDAMISTDPGTTDGDTVSGAVEVTGSVDQEKHIKSHWFEITDPNGDKTYEYNMNTTDKSFSFVLDTTTGDGEYKLRYVATDRAGNRSDSSEPTTYMLVVDNGTIDDGSGDNGTDNSGSGDGQTTPDSGGSGDDNTTTTTGGPDSGGPIIPITPLGDEGQQPPLAFLGNNAGNTGAQDDATDEDDQDVLSSEDNQQDGEVTRDAASSEVLGDEDEKECWDILGLCWYWWLLIIAAVAALIWFIARLRRENNTPDGSARSLG